MRINKYFKKLPSNIKSFNSYFALNTKRFFHNHSAKKISIIQSANYKSLNYNAQMKLKIKKSYCTTTPTTTTETTPEQLEQIETELNKAIEMHNGKKLWESLGVYRNVLKMIGEPNESTIESYAFALLNICQILIMQGYSERDISKIDEALDNCKKLLRISPLEPQGKKKKKNLKQKK